MKNFKKTISCLLAIILLFSFTACKKTNKTNPPKAKCSHSYSSAITKEATWKETGVKTYTCDICGDSYTEDIAKSNTHSYTSEVTKEATCTETGVRTYTCDICGDSYTEDIAKSATHSYTSEVTKEATCIATGIKTYTCDICGDSYTEEIAKTENHNLTRNGNCKRCGLNSTVILEMNETEKSDASKVESMISWNKILTDNSGNYIVKFGLSSISGKIDASTLLAVPALIDITITNSNGATRYAKTKEVKAVDYQMEDGYLVASVKVNVNELTVKNEKLAKLYFSVYIPGYRNFPENELTVPAIIIMPNLPDTIYEYDYNDRLLTGVKITDISYTVNTGSYSSLYFTGEKTYDKEGDLYSRGCSIGYKLYDSEDYLIDSGVYTTNALKVGEKFKNGREYAFYQLLEAGKIYRLEILNVG